MGVSLSKGGNVSLTKEAPGLTAVIVGLGWDVRTTTGTDFDLDASALLTNAEGKVANDQNFVFFNNLKSPDGSVEHTGDNLTGEGEDDRQGHGQARLRPGHHAAGGRGRAGGAL
ncbi:TerD family protein, partial [Streptomyces minutiscleroticus]|uniref:TerD family protein n=1 Tax=Streptomyces minutiscleroticus TaxID=68238 RepID=UPI003331F256